MAERDKLPTREEFDKAMDELREIMAPFFEQNAKEMEEFLKQLKERYNIQAKITCEYTPFQLEGRLQTQETIYFRVRHSLARLDVGLPGKSLNHDGKDEISFSESKEVEDLEAGGEFGQFEEGITDVVFFELLESFQQTRVHS